MPQSPRLLDDHTYFEAHQHAFTWAEKAMLFRSAGNIAEAIAAVDRVRHWLEIIRGLEGHATVWKIH
jgi:hypothetical protein